MRYPENMGCRPEGDVAEWPSRARKDEEPGDEKQRCEDLRGQAEHSQIREAETEYKALG